jgi:fumarate hydratase class I
MAAGAHHMSTNTTSHSTMSSQTIVIKQADFIESIADSLQYISYYHPKDFVDAMNKRRG